MSHELKLPKQWRRWLKKAGLKLSSCSHESRNRRWLSEYCCIKGFNRHWRVDCVGNLDMSEPIGDFDRWANSQESSVPMSAKTEAEFVALVESMRNV